MAMSLVLLLAVRTAIQMVMMTETHLVQMLDMSWAYLTVMWMAISLACSRDCWKANQTA